VRKWSAFFRTHFCTLARYLGDGRGTVAIRNWFSSEHIVHTVRYLGGRHDAVDRTIGSCTLFKGPGVYLGDILIWYNSLWILLFLFELIEVFCLDYANFR
jgi:hypothetical protein